jgi:multiple sugar transport system permease protein
VTALAIRASALRPGGWVRGLGLLGLAALLAVWTGVPVYNLLFIAFNQEDDQYTDDLWPDLPTFDNFIIVLTQDHWYLEHFWRQFGNSFVVGIMTMVLTVLIGALVSFVIGRGRFRYGWLVSNAALLTYVVPSSLLAIPFTRAMQQYGLWDTLTAVVLAEVAFATPSAILIFHQYGRLIPLEVDEAARIDGANPWQIFFRIYLPLMAPALVAVGSYALLLAWNEYLYQFLLLASTRNMTVAVALDQFFDSDEAPWNVMMAVAVIYAIPPLIIFYAMRRSMLAGLSIDGVKG